MRIRMVYWGGWAFLFFLMATVAHAGNENSCRELWVIDTHAVPWYHADEASFSKIVFYRCDGTSWIRSDAEAFAESQQPEIPTIFFVPGYTSTMSDLLQIGGELLRLLGTEKSYRLVLWNWPSEKIVAGLRRDIRAKIPVATANGDYMAFVLRSLKPQSKVALLGFSFGNRVIGDAIESLAGDRPEGMRIRLILAAAATDRNGLADRGRNGNVPKLAEKILVLYNPNDFRLHFYRHLYGTGYRPEALGRFGPPLAAIRPEFRDRIEAVNTHPYVGIRHQTRLFLQLPPFRHRIDSYFFFVDPQDGPCSSAGRTTHF